MEGGGGGGGSVGRAGVVILSLKDWDTPTRPSFVDPAAEKDCRASLREGRDIIRSLVVSWNMGLVVVVVVIMFVVMAKVVTR